MIPVIHALKLANSHRLHCLGVKDENSHEGPACDAFFGRLHSALPYYSRMEDSHWILYDKLCIISNCVNIFFMLYGVCLGISETLWKKEARKKSPNRAQTKNFFSCMKWVLKNEKKFSRVLPEKEQQSLLADVQKKSCRCSLWLSSTEKGGWGCRALGKLENILKRRKMRSEPENEKNVWRGEKEMKKVWHREETHINVSFYCDLSSPLLSAYDSFSSTQSKCGYERKLANSCKTCHSDDKIFFELSLFSWTVLSFAYTNIKSLVFLFTEQISICSIYTSLEELHVLVGCVLSRYVREINFYSRWWCVIVKIFRLEWSESEMSANWFNAVVCAI